MITDDRRTEKQKRDMTVLIVGTDRLMSGWGDAANGSSYAAWACHPDHASAVKAWVGARSDMSRVRQVYSPATAPYRPNRTHCAHLYVYPVTAEHPARR